MANFRCERLYVMLDEPVPGLDHLRAVDPVEFAHHGTDEAAERLGLTALGDCTFAPWELPRWRPAGEGLRTVRGLLADAADRIARDPVRAEVERDTLTVLAQVEAVLAAAYDRDRRFYLKARDLG